MVKLTIASTLAATLIATAAFSYPCSKYVFDFGSQAMPGKIVIKWSINTGFNHCGFEKDEIRNQQFAIELTTLFEEILIRDTVSSNLYSLNTNVAGHATPFIFSIQELGRSEPIRVLINPIEEEMPGLATKIDTLNNYLINGYFLNAVSILYELNRADLIDSVMTEYRILFPKNYPGSRQFFNSYFDERSMRLMKMPYVQGLDVFLSNINKMTRKDPRTLEGFSVYIKLSPDSQVLEHVVVPEKYSELFDLNSSMLSFSNQNRVPSKVILKIGRSKNGKRYSVLNERALTDQNSPNFKRTYPDRGHAIH